MDTLDNRKPEDSSNQPLQQNSKTAQTIFSQGGHESTHMHSYRYIVKSSGIELPYAKIFHESEEVSIDEVIEFKNEVGKKEYYNVEEIAEGEITTIYLVRAKNTLWKTGLLLALLGVSWLAIDFILKQFF